MRARRSDIHEAASSGFSKSAATYVAGRPAYAPQALTDIAEALVDAQGPVVDLGAGTGVMSTLLENQGLRVVAVEPVAQMIANVAPSCHRLSATAQRLPFADRSLGAVVCAQSFHWFSSVEVLGQIAQALEKGGTLVLAWNERDARTPWVSAFDDVLHRYVGDTPRFTNYVWQQHVAESGRFVEVSHCEYDNPAPSSPAAVLARAMSTSFIAALDEGERRRVQTEIESITAALPEQFDFPYTTRLWTYRLASTERRRHR